MLLTIEYPNKETGELVTRRIKVLKVVRAKDGLVIHSHCFLRDNFRKFKVNDISKLFSDNIGLILNIKDFFKIHFSIETINKTSKEELQDIATFEFDKLPHFDYSKFTVCLTGKSWNNSQKKDIYDRLKGLGASTTDNYNKSVNLLIVLGNAKEIHSKLRNSLERRFKKEEIYIISEATFWESIELRIAS